MALKLRV
jgi:Fe-Mn family superoxide dismutase